MVMAIFTVQLFFNALWPVVFFGMHEPGLALPVVVALDLSVYATLWIFFRIDRLSGLSLIPYALWVSFASVLNLAIYSLNLPTS
jgi:tryptophan-rich sensory protein